MPKYIETPDGQIIEFPDSMSDSEIDARLRMKYAVDQGTAEAEAGIKERSEVPAEDGGFMSELSRVGTFGRTPTPEEWKKTREAHIQEKTLAAIPLVWGAPQAVMHPIATAKGLGLAAAGGAVGGYGGHALGSGLEYAGFPEGTSNVLGKVGGLAGGIAGPIAGPKMILRALEMSGGKGSVLSNILRSVLGQSAPATAAEREAARKLRERALAVAEERNRLMRLRLEGKAAPAPKRPASVPKSEPAKEAVPAPTAKAESATGRPTAKGSEIVPEATSENTGLIVQKLRQQMGTAEGRKIVRQLIEQMPKQQAAEIKKLLFGETPLIPNWRAVLTSAAPPPANWRSGRPGEELARLLGQIQ